MLFAVPRRFLTPKRRDNEDQRVCVRYLRVGVSGGAGGQALAKGLVSGEGWWGKKYGRESGADAGNFLLTVLFVFRVSTL